MKARITSGLTAILLAIAGPASAAQLFTSFVTLGGTADTFLCVLTNVSSKDIDFAIEALDAAGQVVQSGAGVLLSLRTIIVQTALPDDAGRCRFEVQSENSVRANATVFSSSTGAPVVVVPAQ